MANVNQPPFRDLNEDAALCTILERTATAAGEQFFEVAAQIIGQAFIRFLSLEDHQKLENLIEQLESLPQGRQYLWIPDGA